MTHFPPETNQNWLVIFRAVSTQHCQYLLVVRRRAGIRRWGCGCRDSIFDCKVAPAVFIKYFDCDGGFGIYCPVLVIVMLGFVEGENTYLGDPFLGRNIKSLKGNDTFRSPARELGLLSIFVVRIKRGIDS